LIALAGSFVLLSMPTNCLAYKVENQPCWTNSHFGKINGKRFCQQLKSLIYPPFIAEITIAEN